MNDDSVSQDVISVDIETFLSMNIQPRSCLMSPWLPSGGLTQVYAYRGVGKTYFALNVAYSVATGSPFLGWDCSEPKRVLYIDGEMPASDMQERLKCINGGTLLDPECFSLITPDLQRFIIPNLATLEGQEKLEPHTSQADLIVVDNISTLCRTGKENDSDYWTPVQQWSLKMRSEKRSVLFVHHANKNGGQRGTSGREDILDTVIALKKPKGSSPTDGATFEVHFEKSRGFCGADAQAFSATMNIENGQQQWIKQSLSDSTFNQTFKLYNEGYHQSEIARKLGVDRSTISRHISRAKQEGLIKDTDDK